MCQGVLYKHEAPASESFTSDFGNSLACASCLYEYLRIGYMEKTAIRSQDVGSMTLEFARALPSGRVGRGRPERALRDFYTRLLAARLASPQFADEEIGLTPFGIRMPGGAVTLARND